MNRFEKFSLRATNLHRILEAEYDGDTGTFARALSVATVTLSKYLNPNSDRPCTDKAARKIEKVLRLEHCFLDRDNNVKKEIYYMALGTNAKHTYETVMFLQSEECVKECSVVLGDIDVWLKVEVENYRLLELLLAKIARLPGVERTTTYFSVNELRWQREQAEDLHVPSHDKDKYFHSVLENFVHQKMEHYRNRVKELESDTIFVKDNDVVRIENHELISSAEKHIYATKLPFEKGLFSQKYLDQERRLIDDGVKSQRIILLDDNYKKNWPKIKKIFNDLKKIGSNIYFIHMNDWIGSPLSDVAEVFLIVDNAFVCLRREDGKVTIIKRNPLTVEEYIRSFKANWAKALSLKEVEDSLHSR